ncbi:MAG: hypothetical protein U5L11_12635 [Arhodomonas sp.]|nr:hypothetical protein [Arhodomonas sp.]
MTGQAWDAADRKGLEAIRDAGIEITEADDAMLDAVAAEAEQVRAQALERIAEKGIDGEAFLEALQRELEAVEAE